MTKRTTTKLIEIDHSGARGVDSSSGWHGENGKPPGFWKSFVSSIGGDGARGGDASLPTEGGNGGDFEIHLSTGLVAADDDSSGKCIASESVVANTNALGANGEKITLSSDTVQLSELSRIKWMSIGGDGGNGGTGGNGGNGARGLDGTGEPEYVSRPLIAYLVST